VNAVIIALQIVMSLILVVVGVLLRRTIGANDRRMDRHEDRITRIERDAVLKEDWLRESAIMRQRLEQLIERLASLNGHNTAALELAAAIRQLAERDHHE